LSSQVRDPDSFRPLSVPPIEIPFRDMASFVAEADASITERFEVLEPKIYNSDARQVIFTKISLLRPHYFE
jgi:hypothetical protein